MTEIESKPIIEAKKPKVEIKGYKFKNLNDSELALVLAIKDLTSQIRRLSFK